VEHTVGIQEGQLLGATKGAIRTTPRWITLANSCGAVAVAMTRAIIRAFLVLADGCILDCSHWDLRAILASVTWVTSALAGEMVAVAMARAIIRAL
jgi:hypothetical protein